MKIRSLDLLARTLTLPAGGASAVAPAVDGGEPAINAVHPDLIVIVDAPSLTTGQLPDGQTLTYQLLESNSADLSAPISTQTIGVQTGAGGAGAGGAVFAGRLKYAGGRYFGSKCVASSTANASGVIVSQSLANV